MGVLLIRLVCIVGCAPQVQQGGRTGGKAPGAGLGLAAKGLVNLILLPIQIAAGMSQGIASVPFYLNISVQKINEGPLSTGRNLDREEHV